MFSGIGAVFWLKTTVFSDALKSDPTVMNLTSPSSGGELLIEDIILKTQGGSGLAGGNTFRILCTNNHGSSVVFQARISELGNSSVMDMATAYEIQSTIAGSATESVSAKLKGTNKPTILEEGKRLTVGNTGAAGSGAGAVEVHIRFRRLAINANVTL